MCRGMHHLFALPLSTRLQGQSKSLRSFQAPELVITLLAGSGRMSWLFLLG